MSCGWSTYFGLFLETANRPTFSLRAGPGGIADEKQKYVIIGVDPDAPFPNNHNLSDIIHFIGGGFTANIEKGGYGRHSRSAILTNTTVAVADYLGPAPPATSDPHRYVVHYIHRTPSED